MTGESPPGPRHEPAVAPEAARAALAGIQASAALVASRQLSAFLAYVVEKTLAGEADRIKAYSIATEALGRPESFDPATDPIVRVEAGRLRKALDTYYKTEGVDARLRISMPRGSYVPRFELATVDVEDDRQADEGEAGRIDAADARPKTAEGASENEGRWWIRLVGAFVVVGIVMALAALGSRYWADQPVPAAAVEERIESAGAVPATKPQAPRIFVAPFAVADEAAVGVDGQQFSAMLATALSRFDEITVVTRMNDDVDYFLSGRLSAGPTGISASTLLTDRDTGRVIWSSQTTLPPNPIRPQATIDQLKSEIATAVAQPYGVVLSDRLARTDRPDDGFPCVIRSFNYWRNVTTDEHDEYKSCLEALTRRYPAYALPYARLALVYLTEDALGRDVDSDTAARDRAVKLATTAVQLAPTSARAQQALQRTYYATGQLQRAIEAGNRAMELNPLDTDIRASQGRGLILAGSYQLGMRLIEEAAGNNTAYPPWYDLYLALAAFQGGQTATLRTLMNRVDLPDHPLAVFLGILAAPDDEARNAALSNMRTRFPAMAADPARVLGRIVSNPALVEKLVAAGRAAGMKN